MRHFSVTTLGYEEYLVGQWRSGGRSRGSGGGGKRVRVRYKVEMVVVGKELTQCTKEHRLGDMHYKETVLIENGEES